VPGMFGVLFCDKSCNGVWLQALTEAQVSASTTKVVPWYYARLPDGGLLGCPMVTCLDRLHEPEFVNIHVQMSNKHRPPEPGDRTAQFTHRLSR
jgi:hypothetical protein